MQGTETGRDKVKKICDVLRKETLEPAMQQAEEMIASAKKRAEEIVLLGEKEAFRIKQEALQEIEKEKNVFQASLGQACKQALSKLKQDIEENLLDKQLFALATKKMQDPHVLSELITAVVKAIEKEGINSSLTAYVPAHVPARAVNELLAQSIVQRLKEKGVLIGLHTGGIELALHENKVTIDLTDKALKEFVSGYVRKDFREIVFGS